MHIDRHSPSHPAQAVTTEQPVVANGGDFIRVMTLQVCLRNDGHLYIIVLSLSHRTQTEGKMIFIHSFIQSGYFYSASLSPLLLRGAPEHINWQCQNLHDEALQATIYSI